MAVIGYVIESPPDGAIFPEGVRVVKWTPLANADTGAPYTAPQFSDKSVQISGTFGVGGTVLIEGSLVSNGTAVWGTLNDPNGNTLSVTAAKVEAVLENTYQIRPNVTAGDGTTALTVRMLISTVARR